MTNLIGSANLDIAPAWSLYERGVDFNGDWRGGLKDRHVRIDDHSPDLTAWSGQSAMTNTKGDVILCVFHRLCLCSYWIQYKSNNSLCSWLHGVSILLLRRARINWQCNTNTAFSREATGSLRFSVSKFLFAVMLVTRVHLANAEHAVDDNHTADEYSTGGLKAADEDRRLVVFGSLIAGSIGSLVLLGIAAVCKKNGECCRRTGYTSVEQEGDSDENSLVSLMNQNEKDMATYGCEIACRKFVLVGIFLGYVGINLGIPFLKWSHTTCDHGFFWEDHMPFLGLLYVTKVVELFLYVSDPTIRGRLPLITFLIKFIPSFLGYADGYTDATSIMIAYSCPGELAQTIAFWMAGTFAVGVVFLQWFLIACIACRDPTQACLMKLIHMDALSACVTLPDEYRWIWTLVNITRTFGEDLPQAVCQTLFLIYIRKNPIMIISVVVGVVTSIKAIYDAMNRAAAGIGARAEPPRSRLYEAIRAGVEAIRGVGFGV